MDIVRTGIGITKTIKNVARSKEILSVFARNGFDEIIIKTGLHKRIPGIVLPRKRIDLALGDQEYRGDDWWRSIGYRLRKSFEELGPSFIKMGQLLSSREDLFPPPFIRQMKLLQNKAKSIPFEQSKETIEKSLGKKIEEIFESFEEEPLGVASIGIVYKAVLKNKQEVVVKVRRPNIDSLIRNDFDILEFVVSQIEKVSVDFKYIGASRVLKDFRKSIQMELNFNIEALNCEKLSKNLTQLDKDGIFVLPKVHREFSTDDVIVLDFLEGKPFNEVHSLAELSSELIDNLEKSIALFIHTLLKDGFFHADLHGGNFFLLQDNKIGIIDFGLMGSLSRKSKSSLVAILYSLTSNNYENLVYEFLDVAEYEEIPNQEILVRDVRDAIMPFIGLSVQETNIAELVSILLKTLSRHKIFLPREWFIIFRALMTLDGVGKSIGLDLNIYNLVKKEIGQIVTDVFSLNEARDEAIWLGRDFINSMRILPRHTRWFLKEFSKNNYALNMNVKLENAQISELSRSFIFIGYMLLSGLFFLCGVMTLENQRFESFYSISLLSWGFWTSGLLLLLKGFRSLMK